MKKTLFTLLSLILIFSTQSKADECNNVADADQQFITDLCAIRWQWNGGTFMNEICSENFIVKAKEKMNNEPFIYSNRTGLQSETEKKRKMKGLVTFRTKCTPEGISITDLYISNEPLGELPESIKNLKHLETLGLCSAQFAEVPAVIADIPNLKVLIMSFNNIINLSSLRNSKSLEIVDLSENEITDFSAALTIPTLKELNLASNPLNVDSSAFDQALQLKEFTFTTNHLSSKERKALMKKYEGKLVKTGGYPFPQPVETQLRLNN